MLQFASIIELYGLREMADEDPDCYLQKTNDFLNCIRNCLNDKDKSLRDGFAAHYVLETCLIDFMGWKLSDVVDFINELRCDLFLRNKVMFRSIITTGNLGIIKSKIQKGTIDGFVLNCKAAELFGKYKKVKGVAFTVTDDVISLASQEAKTANEAKMVKEALMVNYYLTKKGPTVYYNKFTDVSLPQEFICEHNFETLLNHLTRIRATIPDSGKMLVPLFVNWVRNMKLSPPFSKEDAPEMQLDRLMINNKLDKLKKIEGIELVFLTLLDRVFKAPVRVQQVVDNKLKKHKLTFLPSNNNGIDLDRFHKIVKYFINNAWIHDFVMSPEKRLQIPEEILSSPSITNYALLSTELMRYT